MNAKELGAQPAMPSSSGHQDARNIGWIGGGLTKRELFAAMAMQGMVSDAGVYGASTELADKKGIDVTAVVADAAVCFADALLAELAKDQP